MTQASRIRSPAVAGLFYPADPVALARDVDRMLADCPREPGPMRPRALLAPHAGHRYSGALAARAFSTAAAGAFETVVLVGPSHVEAFDFTAVYDGEGFATPLGVVPVDQVLAGALAAAGGSIRRARNGHADSPRRGEHALEVLLPFLQRTLGAIRIVPITMGSQSSRACRELGDALARHADPARTLLVASSDLSHFHPYDEAVALDSVFCDLFAALDTTRMLDALASGRCEACGGGPVAAVLMACLATGAVEARLLGRCNSGDITGDHDSVVGYAAGAVMAGGL